MPGLIFIVQSQSLCYQQPFSSLLSSMSTPLLHVGSSASGNVKSFPQEPRGNLPTSTTCCIFVSFLLLSYRYIVFRTSISLSSVYSSARRLFLPKYYFPSSLFLFFLLVIRSLSHLPPFSFPLYYLFSGFLYLIYFT